MIGRIDRRLALRTLGLGSGFAVLFLALLSGAAPIGDLPLRGLLLFLALPAFGAASFVVLHEIHREGSWLALLGSGQSPFRLFLPMGAASLALWTITCLLPGPGPSPPPGEPLSFRLPAGFLAEPGQGGLWIHRASVMRETPEPEGTVRLHLGPDGLYDDRPPRPGERLPKGRGEELRRAFLEASPLQGLRPWTSGSAALHALWLWLLVLVPFQLGFPIWRRRRAGPVFAAGPLALFAAQAACGLLLLGALRSWIPLEVAVPAAALAALGACFL